MGAKCVHGQLASWCAMWWLYRFSCSRRLDRRHPRNATFMIHRTMFSPQAATVYRLQSAANAAALDDKRIEGILQQHISLPKEKLDIHKVSDLWLSAEEAVEAKLADSSKILDLPLGSKSITSARFSGLLCLREGQRKRPQLRAGKAEAVIWGRAMGQHAGITRQCALRSTGSG